MRWLVEEVDLVEHGVGVSGVDRCVLVDQVGLLSLHARVTMGVLANWKQRGNVYV